MKTKEEKEELNRKYGEISLNTPSSISELTKKLKEDILKSLRDKEITFIDTDSVYYK